MPTELFANNAAFQLASGCANTDTTLVLNSAVPAALQATGQWRALITDSNGSEYVIIPGGQSGPTVTGVTRGAEGTTATGHSQGSWVTHIVTAGAILNSIGSAVTVGAVTDSLGRTGILGSAADPAPAIASQVSIMDRPWGAKCDARVVTDGAMTAGSNILTSTGAYAVGNVVVVQTAGPNVAVGGESALTPGVLIGWVTSVGAGTATLMTTKGGSTPANASFTVSGATVKFGTDDTAAIQAALNAVSSTASLLGVSGTVGAVHLPENRAAMIASQINPANNALLWMYGSTLHLATTNASSSSSSMMFRPATNVSLSNFHLRGGTFPGTGTESGNSGSQGIIYFSNAGFGQNGSATYTDISIQDVTVTNWRTAVFDIRGGSRIRESNNTFKSCSQYAGLNTINVIMGGGASPVDSADVFIQNNYFTDNGAEAIAIGEAGTPTGGFSRAVVTGNIIIQTGGVFAGVSAGAAGIDIEWSTTTTGQGRDVIISNNVVFQNATPGGGSSWCISAGGNSQPANAHYHQRIMVTDNICVSKDGGITVNSDDAVVEGNIINWGSTAGNTLRGLSVGGVTTLSVTADTNSSTSLTNVVVNAGGVAENGMFLTGSGITAGTYLVSGAGTSTWTISLPATTTAAGNALTGFVHTKRNQVNNNQIYTGVAAANTPVNIQQMADSRVTNNLVYCEPSRTITGQAGASILINKMLNSDVADNRIQNASAYGIKTDSTANVHVERNRISNPNQSGAGSTGAINMTNASGLPFFIRDNYCWDDQAVHTMFRAVDTGTTNGLCMLVGNDSRGATDSSPYGLDTNYLLSRGNTGDQAAIPKVTFAVTVTASVFTTAAVSYPCMVAVQGGTVTLIQHNRTGSSTRNLSSTTNVTAYLMPGDTISITYSVAPTVNVFPMQ